MSFWKILFIWLSILFFGDFYLNGQSYRFDHYMTERGLPISTTNHSIYSHDGFYYIATEGAGLVRFDGKSLSTVSTDIGLTSIYINRLKNHRKKLFIATANGLFHLDSGNVTVNIENANFTCFCEDPKGELYSGASNGIWMQTTEGWSKYIEEDIPINSCSWIGDTLWIISDNKVFWVDEKKKLRHIPLPIKARFIEIWPEKNSIIIGAIEGVFSFEPKSTTPIHPILPFPFKDVRSFAFSPEGVWLGSYEHGIVFLKNKENLPIQINESNGLPSNRVRSLQLDPFGKLWIGSVLGWSKLINPSVKNYPLPENNSVIAVFDQVNLGTWVGGTFGLKQKLNATFTSIPSETGSVFDIHLQAPDKLWFGTETGIYQYANNQQKFNKEQSSENLNFALSIASSGDSLFVGTVNGLLLKVNDSWETLSLAQLPQGSITNLAFSRKTSTLFFQVIGKGIFALNLTNFSIVEVPLTENINIASTAVINNQLWVGTNGNGLYIFEKNIFQKKYTQTEGLLSSNIWSIEQASEGSIWLGTEKGLQEVMWANKKLTLGKIITREDGLDNQEINKNALFFNPDNNTLLAGTQGGYSEIQLSEINKKTIAPRIHINAIKLFFQPITSQQTNQKLSFPHDENYLSFEFSATSAFFDNQLVYEYILEGQDDAWTLAGEKREAIFTNIRPGKYLLRIRATDPSTNLGEIKLPFTITPAFWQTLWFYVLLLALLGGGVYLYIRQRITTLNEKLALESQKAEWERKALRLQMNPHFIFNALDGITGFIFKNDTKSAVKYLSSFAKLMRLTLESSRESFIPLETEIQILKNYLALEQLRFSSQFDYEIQVDPAIDRYGTLPPMMLQPHVENAILHGLRPLPEDKKGKITITFSSETEDTLRCVITDNGIGRVAAAELKTAGKTRHKSLASTITQNRITLFERTYGKGFGFEIEDRVASDGSSLGTSVHIVLPFREDADSF